MDIDELYGKLKQDQEMTKEELYSRLKQDQEVMKEELRTEIRQSQEITKEELKAEIRQVQEETNNRFDKMTEDISNEILETGKFLYNKIESLEEKIQTKRVS